MRRNVRGWLLWLALILPIAQAMAGVHALSHVGDSRDDGIAHLVHCDLCLTAADLGLSYAELGTLIGTFFLPGLVLAIPAGYVGRYASDRV